MVGRDRSDLTLEVTKGQLSKAMGTKIILFINTERAELSLLTHEGYTCNDGTHPSRKEIDR